MPDRHRIELVLPSNAHICFHTLDDGRMNDATPTHGGNGGNAACSFDFVYGGKTFSKCTKEGHDKEWCATTENFDKDGLWGFCGEGMSYVLVYRILSFHIVHAFVFS